MIPRERASTRLPAFININVNTNTNTNTNIMPSIHVSSISLSTFKAKLSRYSNTAPSALTDLDLLRYEAIPANLAKIKKDASLQKSDVEELVKWKL